MIQETFTHISQLPAVRQLVASTAEMVRGESLSIGGMAGSLDAFVASILAEETGRQLLIVVPDRVTAVRLTDDLKLLADSAGPLHFASVPHRADRPGSELSGRVDDVECLRAMVAGIPPVIVTQHDALRKRLPAPEVLRSRLLSVEIGAEQRPEDLVQILEERGFVRSNFIESVGDYSVRGGIMDIFPFVGENPVRLEFNGDLVESIREFDPLSQRSIRGLNTASLIPDLLSEESGYDRSHSLFDFLSDDALLLLYPPAQEESTRETEEELWSREETAGRISDRSRLVVSLGSEQQIDLGATPQPAFNGSIRFVREYLSQMAEEGGVIHLGCDTDSELARLKELLVGFDREAEPDGSASGGDKVLFLRQSIHEGFEFRTGRFAVLTEHQIFSRRKRVGRRAISRRKRISEREIRQLRKDDFVVHADYGIGRFAGLETITVQGIHHDVLRVFYEGGDVLSVNLNFVNRVQKYSSKEGHLPKLSRLGTPEWQKLRNRAKGKIKDIARDLMRLYAERRNAEGTAFREDTPWQKELEASFIFEDTVDQARTTAEVKADMEAPFPMDRLICGDVGFGKTEIAVRAAFKAVMEGKQVAVLVPTTILALQHFNTFSDRLGRYSTAIEVISRLKTKQEQQATLERVRTGKTDIIIGTHRLLSKDVSFKDLGLLIVDEEHRFGVAAKEKLRQKKSNVDTLTLTATPIPRTLHFSLMGARDLSLIATPPLNRLPIVTEIIEMKEDLIRDAVLREIHRGGQVYVVHDRVNDIAEFTARLSRIVPGVRLDFAHGQMAPRELEQVMVSFLERKLDILVCTKIIESGLDIPNVNTIIINRADRFGMAELYQLRGRVGRSNQQAFAFLIAPPVAALPKESLRRLMAMQEFTELGSGFNLAMRDLEIRGAGNLLGSEQSGFISEMGFETYTKILEEAVAELREEEFQDNAAEPPAPRPDDTVMEVETDALIPASYIEHGDARLEIYRRLYAVNSREEVLEIGDELRDRFGQLPVEVTALLDLLVLRLAASALGCRKVKVTRKWVEMEVNPDPNHWNDSLAGTFVAAIGSIRSWSVSISDTSTGMRVRILISNTDNILETALSALESISPALRILRPRGVGVPTPVPETSH
ncbi:MAG: transcription-repair coupling factor [Ignavibacteria bacterium]|nr:transcription-repair coupling factor [Ignavibacteria bacterium]